MMPQVRETAELAEKWVRNASNAVTDYQRGVQNPKRDWKTETLKAEQRWAQGVQQAIQDRRFVGGVNKAGTEAWQQGAINKGPSRYAQGVAQAKEVWAREWEPYRQVLLRLELPERGPKGDRRNFERVVVVGTALHEAARRRKGAGGG